MRYRMHTGESLSEIGLGCYALSGVYGHEAPEEFIDLFRQAYELGVTFFDTADVYGPAEEILGRAVAPFRDQVWVATKVGARSSGGADCSAEHVRASCEASLERLGTEVIDLYQIHFDDPHTPVGETIEALEQLKAAGKIRHYGVGHLPAPRLRAFFEAGDPFSELTELSAVARGRRERILPLCQDYDVGVIAFSVTGRGLLAGAIRPNHVFEPGDIRRIDPLFQHERFTSGLRVAEKFRTLGTKYGKTPVQVAIAWVLAQPGVICALTGPSTRPHLEENLGGSGWAIAPDDLAELERFFQREDDWLCRQQVQSLEHILTQRLEPESAFNDLVYALEALAELKLAEEKEILPLFQQLWALRKQQKDAAALEHMETIQTELCQRFLPTLGLAPHRQG